MSMTLNQFLFLILTLAAVVAVVFLVRFLIQVRRTAQEGERTLTEFRKLAESLTELDLMVKERLEDLGQTLEASKRVALNLTAVTGFMTTRLFRPATRYWPVLLPVVSFLWRRMKKRKEK